MIKVIIFSLLGIGVGLLFLVKTDWLVQNIGRISWAEYHMSEFGGSRFLYKMIGVLVCFFSLLYVTGLLPGFIQGVARTLFGIG